MTKEELRAQHKDDLKAMREFLFETECVYKDPNETREEKETFEIKMLKRFNEGFEKNEI